MELKVDALGCSGGCELEVDALGCSSGCEGNSDAMRLVTKGIEKAQATTTPNKPANNGSLMVFGGLGSGGRGSSGIGFGSKIVVELEKLPQSPCQVSGSTLGPMQIVGNQIAPG